MRREAEAAGLAELAGGAVIFNTCAVTGEAVRQARQSIRKARRENPDARIIVTGCAAQTEPATLCRHGGGRPRARQRGEADGACLSRAAGFRRQRHGEGARQRHHVACGRPPAHMVEAMEGRARAFVQVQNGCDHRCTFCIIPYRPRQFALGADGRGGRADPPPGRQRLSRGGADRRRHHRLRRRPARQPEARQAGARRSCGRCRTADGCGSPRSTPSRPTTS